MTRRQPVPCWFSLLLAVFLITAMLPNDPVGAAQKQSLGWLVTTVVDRNGRPVDAIVVIRGALYLARSTDGLGRYVVAVPPGRYLVSAIYAGQATPSRSVTVLPGRTQKTTIALNVNGRPAPPVAGVQKLPAPSQSGVATTQPGDGTGQVADPSTPSRSASSGSTQPGDGTGQTASASTPSGGASSGSAQAPGSPVSGATHTGSSAGATHTGSSDSSSNNSNDQESRPAKIGSLKANPSVIQPGGTSTVSAEVSNPDNLVLTFSWQASGGSISGTNPQALWVAPQSTGQFAVTLTVKDVQGRTSSGTVAVYAQAPTPPGRMAGEVTDTFGAALSGASVFGAGPQSWSVITDASGKYLSPDLPAGSYSVTASLSDYTALTQTANAVSGSTVVANFALAKTVTTGRIGGRVTDAATGAGIQAATVSGSGPQAWNLTTDASGYYASSDLPTGTYVVAAAKSGYDLVSISVSVGAGALTTAGFELRQTASTRTRDPALWPFDTHSPWNMPIGTGAVYANISGNPNWNLSTIDFYFNSDAHTIAIWIAKTTDPVRTVTVYARDGAHAIPNVDPSQANYCTDVSTPAVFSLRIPDNALPSPPITWPPTYTGDQHMIVLDPERKTVHELYLAAKDKDGINWQAYGYFAYDIAGIGYGSPKTCKHTGRASNVHALGGVIRTGELRNGIKHAMMAAIGGSQFNRFAPSGKSYVWPATSSDDPTGYSTVGNVYMGSLLAIPASVNLDALPFQSVEGKNVARAMQLYGFYVVEGGPDDNQLVGEVDWNARSEVPHTDAFGADLGLAARYLKVVTNNGPTSVGGGGRPLAPLAPSLAPQGSFQGEGSLMSNVHDLLHIPIPVAAAAVTTFLPLAHRRVRTYRRR